MMPLVVMDADVAPTDSSVLGSPPSLVPTTALMPACAPMVGLAATFGTMIIPELLCAVSALRCGWMIVRERSPKSYCLFRFMGDVVAFFPLACSESDLRES